MGHVSHVKDERKKLANEVHGLARLRTRLMSISDGCYESETSLVAEVK